MSYWAERVARAQSAITNKTIKDIQKQLKKYYAATMEKVIADFEATYDKITGTVDAGREPTPADLYKLDRYWQMQAQLRTELQKLGDKEIALMSEKFEKEWKRIYDVTALPSSKAFSTISKNDAHAMINTAWLSDGKNFSQRVWGNTEKLAMTLNDNLMHCLITGKPTSELKKLLQERFFVSYNRANTLVKTEATHIQTQAAAQRYQDYGLKYYEFLADPDEKTCSVCAALDKKKFLYSEMVAGKNAPPMHPNDRCTIIPVIDNESEQVMEKEVKNKCIKCGKEIADGKKYCDDCAAVLDARWLDRVKKAGFQYNPQTDDIERTEKSDRIFDYNYGYDGKHDNLMYYCIDCGEPFFTTSKKAVAQKRCPECQAKYRKAYKAQKEKERRKKNKKT